MDKATLLLQIQRRIEEIKSRSTEYKDLLIVDGTRDPAGEPHVGIWWLFQGRILRHSVVAATCPDPSDPQCVEVEHIYTWPLVQQAFSLELPELLELGYADVSRGRVWYHRGFTQFSVTCAPIVANDPAALRLIAKAFGLGNRGYSLVIDPQYPR